MTVYKHISLFLIFFGSFYAALGQKPAGFVFDMEGTGTLKEASGKKISTLSKSDFIRVLQTGQKLTADKNAKIFIVLCNKKEQIVGPRTFMVPSCKQDEVPRWIEKFPTGGESKRRVSRGPGDFILFPLESGNVKNIIRPETSVFRWIAINEKLQITLKIQGKDEIVFEQNDIDGKRGQFSSSKLKDVLREISGKNPGAIIQLSIRTATTSNSAVFEIFSQAKETDLQQRLKLVESENSLLNHLERAYIFEEYALYNEAAEEYENSIKFSPPDLNLLEVAANAEDFAGNLERRRELEAEIQELRSGNKK